MQSQLHDQSLLELLNRDPERAMEGIFRRYYPYVCLRILRIVNEPAVAEDLAQDVFLELWRRRAQLQITSSLQAYLGRAGSNRALNYLRDQRLSFEETGEDLRVTPPAAEELLEASDLQNRVDSLLDALPERCRLVFVLSRFEEMSNQEIADALGISIKTVENQMTKALRWLREGLDSYLH